MVDLAQEYAKGARFMILRHRLVEGGVPAFDQTLFAGTKDEVLATFYRERRNGFAVNARIIRTNGTTNFY